MRSIIGVLCNGGHILGQQNPLLAGTPSQNGGIIRTREPDILDPNDI